MLTVPADGAAVHYPAKPEKFEFDQEVAQVFPDMRRAVDLTGKRFERLVVVSRAANTSCNKAAWRCRCDCGAEKVVSAANLKAGNTKSCGCLNREQASSLSKTHGMSGTPTYNSWHAMMQRCYEPSHPYYDNYGGRGVTVAPSWHNFSSFYEDMGERPEGTTLDRKQTALVYSRETCRWATGAEQAKNRRSTVRVLWKGKKVTLIELSSEFSIPYDTLKARIQKLGWSVTRAVTTPVRATK